MRRLVAFVGAIGLVLGSSVIIATAAGANGTISVLPGRSIQAAIDAARPGQAVFVSPGVYKENLSITKDGISIVARGVTLAPPTTAAPTPCDPITTDNGVCVAGLFDPASGAVTQYVRGVQIIGLEVDGFAGVGIFGIATDGLRVIGTTAANNGSYGIFVNSSMHSLIAANTAHGSREAGIYVGDAPNATAIISSNTVFNNAIGLFQRSAENTVINLNNAYGNCVGILLLADAPGPAGRSIVVHNQISQNNKACPAVEDTPALSGIGIAAVGAHDNIVAANQLFDNEPTGPSFASGGILLISGMGPAGTPGTAPMNNLVAANRLDKNEPSDLIWDGTGTGNVFVGNQFTTANPPTLS